MRPPATGPNMGPMSAGTATKLMARMSSDWRMSEPCEGSRRHEAINSSIDHDGPQDLGFQHLELDARCVQLRVGFEHLFDSNDRWSGLSHALLVADDDVRRLQLHQLLQPVVAVDDAAIEVIQVRGREAAAIERNEWTQLRRNHRDDIENHPVRLVGRLTEAVDDLQSLGKLQLLLHRALAAHLRAQLLGQLLDVDAAQQLLDRLGAHLRPELRPVVLTRLAILLFVEQLVLLQLRLARIDDDVGLEVEDALEIAQRDVQQMADAARQPLEEPDVADRRRQRDVAQALASDLGLRHLDAALVADHPAVLHVLEQRP